MLTINKVFPEKTIPEKTDSFLFFDIETTGFSKDNTILYLIGCGYFIENGFQLNIHNRLNIRSYYLLKNP